MKALIVVAAIALVGVLATPAAGALPPRTLRRLDTPGPLLQAAGLGSLDCGGETLSCSDCYTVLNCTKIGNLYRPVSSSACPAAAPYCSAGACVDIMPHTDICTNAPQPVADFACNGNGYFPDPASCKHYHLCVNGHAYTYNCTRFPNTVYSHAAAKCIHQSKAPCTTAVCRTDLIGAYQMYEQDNSVYFVCTDTTPANAYVGACPKDHKVNAEGNCVLACLREGRLPHENSNMYYECTQTSSTTFIGPNPATCPDVSTFDVASERCVFPETENGFSDYNEDLYITSDSVSEDLYKMPPNFKVGATTAAYQVEGAWNEDGKTPNVQDVYFHSRPHLVNGDIACDSYHRWQEDIELLKVLKMQMYRFSFSWARLLPTGGSDNPNQAGIDYYNNLINGLIDAGIEPLVTLHHWDIPQIYQDDGGWINSAIQDRFADYSDFAFRTFGDRVKKWITMNEPHVFCSCGYEIGIGAPGVTNSGTGAYDCMHNMILAHSKAYRIYESRYKADQEGMVGSTLDLSFGEPRTRSPADTEAANRHMEFMFAWFADPVTFGDYPAAMRNAVDTNSRAEGRTTSRLPYFTNEEKTIIKGSWDFIGLNHYDSKLVSPGTVTLQDTIDSPSAMNDVNVTTELRSTWLTTSKVEGLPVTPWGMRGVLNWINKRYNNMPIMITENGYASHRNEGTSDQGRIGFHSGYIRALLRAINEDGVNVLGYNIWTLIDNVEWAHGYGIKYGMVYVDFDSPNRTRTLKQSSTFFQEIMTNRYVHYVKATPATG